MDCLVHIGAPTSRIADERYRAQAAAYANYEPSTRVLISQHERDTTERDPERGPVAETTPTQVSADYEDSPSSLGPDPMMADKIEQVGTQGQRSEATAGLLGRHLDESGPSLSARRSPLERLEILQQEWRRHSKAPRRQTAKLAAPAIELGSGWRYDTQLAASILESQLANQQSSGEILEPSPKRRKTEHPGQSCIETDVSLELGVPHTIGSPIVHAAPTSGQSLDRTHQRQRFPKTPDQDSLTSLLPSIYSLSDTTTETSARHSQQSASHSQAQSMRQPLQAIRPNASPPKAAAEATTLHPRSRTAEQTSDSSKPKTYAASSTRPQQSQTKLAAGAGQQRPRSLHSLPLEARSPPPRTPTASDRPPPTSHITKKLQTLRDLPALASRYAPTSTARGVAAGERGRWEFTVRGSDEATMLRWPAEQQALFWESLCGLVRDGSLGWCVWCVRQPLEDGDGRLDSRGSNGAALGRVRVFCWGEVVQHMWLLLYTLSNNRIRKLSLQWIDSKGEVVVQTGLSSGAAAM